MGGKKRRINTAPAPTLGVIGPAGAPALANRGSVVAPPSADPCLPPLHTLRRRASELTQEMTDFCLGDTQKINKWQMAVITAKFGEMGGIVGDLLLRNARLEGRLVELTKRPPVATSDGLAGGRVIESKQSYSDMLKSSSGRTGTAPTPPVTKVTVRTGPGLVKTAAASRASAAGAQTHGVTTSGAPKKVAEGAPDDGFVRVVNKKKNNKPRGGDWKPVSTGQRDRRGPYARCEDHHGYPFTLCRYGPSPAPNVLLIAVRPSGRSCRRSLPLGMESSCAGFARRRAWPWWKKPPAKHLP